jgi:hypothetical protein
VLWVGMLHLQNRLLQLANLTGTLTTGILLLCAHTQALSKLAPHIQQVSMESNGKGVDIHGRPLPFDAGGADCSETATGHSTRRGGGTEGERNELSSQCTQLGRMDRASRAIGMGGM